MTRHSPDPKKRQLLALSEEVNRVAESLAQLALAPAPVDAAATGEGDADLAQDTLEWAIRARRERARFLPAQLLGEPAWDIMLCLLEAEYAQQRVSLSTVCEASGVPERVALRWLNGMADERLVAFEGQPGRPEIEAVRLTAEASSALRRYLREVTATR
jgi:hypothetical protein